MSSRPPYYLTKNKDPLTINAIKSMINQNHRPWPVCHIDLHGEAIPKRLNVQIEPALVEALSYTFSISSAGLTPRKVTRLTEELDIYDPKTGVCVSAALPLINYDQSF